MCGRYVNVASAEDLLDEFDADRATGDALEPSTNMEQTDPVGLVVNRPMKAAEATLKSTPVDEKANGEAGAYLAIGKGDWDAGLKLLVKGPAGEMKTAAEKDLARPTDTDGVLALADAWADVAEHETSV